MSRVAGEVGADTKHALDTSLARLLNLHALLKVERVAEDYALGHWVDTQLLVAVNSQVDKGDWVARVLTYAIEETGVLLRHGVLLRLP